MAAKFETAQENSTKIYGSRKKYNILQNFGVAAQIVHKFYADPKLRPDFVKTVYQDFAKIMYPESAKIMYPRSGPNHVTKLDQIM